MNSVLVDHEFMMNNIFKFNSELLSNFSNNEETFQNQHDFVNHDYASFFEQNEDYNSPEIPEFAENNQFQQNESNNIRPEIPDFPDDCLKFITDILLEEGFDENPASAQECKALQDTEKSLYDALGAQYPYPNPNPNPNPNPSPESLTLDSNVEGPDGSSISSDGSLESNLSQLMLKLDSVGSDDFGQLDGQNHSPSVDKPEPVPKEKLRKQVIKSSRRKKGRRNDEGEKEDGRVQKIQATSNEDYVEMEQYDDVLLCSEYDQQKFTDFSTKGSSKSSRNKKQNNKHDEVDLRVLLTQCAQAVSTFDLKTANELLRQIRQHASPYGDSVQRLAHHVASGLEARIAGTGSTVSADIVDVKISTADFLKAYRMYVSAIPFKRMSYFVANTTILKLAEKAKKIHIIDFGIFLGLQWPCLIKRLSKFPNRPSLRITGIDFPQQGFRPAARIDATGRRLAGYSERFGVPFQYTGIADKWENIKPSDLKIESDELVIVNCMYRSGTLHDETVDTNSPRDKFLKLVQSLKPDLFVHGVINGTFNAPFFITRFKEAIYHYSSVFEVFEATMARESHERLLIESEAYGKEVYNLVACEGVERVQRPESYKQWQVRQARAGLQKTTLDRELVSQAKAMVKGNYHGDFLVDEDKNWMLQGWKGRIFCALSFWRPSLL